MNPSLQKQKNDIELRLARNRAELAKVGELPVDEQRSAETMERVSKINAEMRSDNEQLATVLQALPGEARVADGMDPEVRERDQLRKRSSLSRFIEARLNGRVLDGSEEEYRAATGVTPGSIPLELFEPRDWREERAITGAPAVGTPVNTTPVAPYVFASSLAPSLAIEIRSAGAPGAYNVPRITTPPAAGAGPVAAGAAADETAGVMDIVSTNARRLPASVRTNIEGIWQLGQEYEDALRESVRMQLSDALDNQIINGAAAAPNLNGLITQIGLPNAAETSVVDWADAIGSFVDRVDGLWAGSGEEVFGVVHPTGYKFIGKLYRTPLTSGAYGEVSAAQHINQRTAGLRAHTRMPDEYDSGTLDNHVAVLYARRGRSGVTRAILPTWGEIAIDDPYSDAAKGERVYTFTMGVGALVLVHSAAYAVGAWKLS